LPNRNGLRRFDGARDATWQYHAAVRLILPAPAVSLALLAACGSGTPELDGTWASDREATAEVTIAADRVTMTVPGLKPTVYGQRAERTANGYLLRWTKEDGETLRVEARLEGDRLLLSFEGQEFALRRVVAR
jgi:hypothetical protein